MTLGNLFIFGTAISNTSYPSIKTLDALNVSGNMNPNLRSHRYLFALMLKAVCLQGDTLRFLSLIVMLARQYDGSSHGHTPFLAACQGGAAVLGAAFKASLGTLLKILHTNILTQWTGNADCD